MKLSKHFSRPEFACNCGCGFDTVDSELLDLLEHIRTHFDAPVHITSAARCASWNAEVGGSEKSQHLLGRAADIQVSGVEPAAVQSWLRSTYPGQYGIGSYDTFTHVDSRGSGARWG